MATLAVTNTFVNNTVADGTEVNTNFSDVVDYINDRNDGTEDWEQCDVTATTATPMTISSNQATTTVAINNTATDGDPILQFQLGGVAQFTMGVDDGDSDTFKIGTTAIGTSTSVKIAGTDVGFPGTVSLANGSAAAPSLRFTSDTDTGAYVTGTPGVSFTAAGAQVGEISTSGLSINADGAVGTPAITLGGDPDSGWFRAGANQWSLALGGQNKIICSTTQINIVPDGSGTAPGLAFGGATDDGIYRNTDNELSIALGGAQEYIFKATEFVPAADNANSCGTNSLRWSDLRSVLINGADYGFHNGWILREYPATFDDVQTKGVAWFEANANQGIQVINDIGETVMVIGRDGTLYVKNGVKDFAQLSDISTMESTEKARKLARTNG